MKILVIDDEPQIRRALRAGLSHAGHEVSLAANGEEGLDLAALHEPDVIILDMAMPGMDGLEVCRQVREWSQVPIVVLSVRDGPQDKIAALDMGADDYLTKPFSIDELLARIRAVRRRLGAAETPPPAEIAVGDMLIRIAFRQVTVAGVEIHLTPIEYDMLCELATHPNLVLTHRHLLAKVWGDGHVDDLHTLRVHMANLRTKIEPDPTRPRYISTVPRIGYRFRADEAGPD
ncbi:MAG: response regulator transcription factor [Candidatus Sericytochromatia bacterium]|nr:response regulator transcription factor [Candidatus Sericytochromatia bacterium]